MVPGGLRGVCGVERRELCVCNARFVSVARALPRFASALLACVQQCFHLPSCQHRHRIAQTWMMLMLRILLGQSNGVVIIVIMIAIMSRSRVELLQARMDAKSWKGLASWRVMEEHAWAGAHSCAQRLDFVFHLPESTLIILNLPPRHARPVPATATASSSA